MVSQIARKALIAACEACGVAPDSAVERWTQAGYLEDETMVRRLARGDKEAFYTLEDAGCDVPLALGGRLDEYFRAMRTAPEEVRHQHVRFFVKCLFLLQMRKRQRTATPSDKRNLIGVLDGLDIFNDYTFEPRPDYQRPSEQTVYDVLRTVLRSLLVDDTVGILAPEQIAREFIYQVKGLLPDKYINEVKLPSGGVKRPDVIVLSANEKRTGLIELKRYLTQPEELRLALAQIAVYAACSAGQEEDVGRNLRFVLLEGFAGTTTVLIKARVGVCYFGADSTGEHYVQRVRYESRPVEFCVRPTEKEEPHYLFPDLINILERLFWVGGGESAVLNISGDIPSDDPV